MMYSCINMVDGWILSATSFIYSRLQIVGVNSAIFAIFLSTFVISLSLLSLMNKKVRNHLG